MRLAGESAGRRMRFDLAVRTDRMLLPHRTTEGRIKGRVRIEGLAVDVPVCGEMEISPLARRRIRYRMRFTVRGRHYTLDGWKSVSPRRPLASLTVLPFVLLDGGQEAGHGQLRFEVARSLVPFVTSFRWPRLSDEPASLHARRWEGEPGRTEVWYTTVTDPVTGTGLWLHHELTAPSDGSSAYAHGWVGLFPPDAPPQHARFGPDPVAPSAGPVPQSFAAERVEAGPDRLRGTAGAFAWDLTRHSRSAALYTFPRWAWRRGLLPAAHLVSAPSATYTGSVTHEGRRLPLEAAPGADARIYGEGNALRWAWLHADLGAGDILEIVAAVSKKAGLRRLPPTVFLRLRRNGGTWPRTAERSAVGWLGAGRFRARIGLPSWTVTGRSGLHRIRVRVTQPVDRTLALEYTDPDGSTAVCRNSETSDARIEWERWWGRWRTEATWSLSGTAHAEVGER
ncbi:hypothetical protein [Streptomyces sp. NPDC015125]|uniref:hypothetical protein n=1 Tax=Streptomyces sp. NPDC015125 TaxID=3364938 RepID=UPI0036FD8BC4